MTDLEQDLVAAIAPVLLERAEDGVDMGRVVREVAGAAAFRAAALGLGDTLPPEMAAPAPRVEVFDVRDGFEDLVPWLAERKRVRVDWRKRPVFRKPAEVRLLMLHQMAVTFGREGQAFAERAGKTAYHVAVSDDGGAVGLLKPWLAYANHGGHANRPSVGLGVEGTFPGEARRRGRKHTPITPGLEAGIRRAMERVLADLDLEALVAHRQSSANRRGDPGEELWTIGADVARSLGLRVDLTTTWHDGKPIPGIWGGPSGVAY